MSDFLKRYTELRGEEHVNKLIQEGRVAAQIKRVRKDLSMSQQMLADLVGVPKSTIGRFEAGLTSPKEDTIKDISRVLDTPFIIDGTQKSDDKNLYV